MDTIPGVFTLEPHDFRRMGATLGRILDPKWRDEELLSRYCARFMSLKSARYSYPTDDVYGEARGPKHLEESLFIERLILCGKLNG
jgi:hypothetical protein